MIYYWPWTYNTKGLLYKNWLTLGEWLRELYIKSVYVRYEAFPGYKDVKGYHKTVKGTSPIRRNRPRGRV